MSDTPVVKVEYGEGTKPKFLISYEGKVVVFEKGDPVIDYFDLTNWILDNEIGRCMFSSSYDHFLMDTEEWCERIIIEDSSTNSGGRFADEDDIKCMSFDEMMTLPTVITNDSIKSFEEFKEYVKR